MLSTARYGQCTGSLQHPLCRYGSISDRTRTFSSQQLFNPIKSALGLCISFFSHWSLFEGKCCLFSIFELSLFDCPSVTQKYTFMSLFIKSPVTSPSLKNTVSGMKMSTPLLIILWLGKISLFSIHSNASGSQFKLEGTKSPSSFVESFLL